MQKDIKNYEDYYYLTIYGEIFSKDRVINGRLISSKKMSAVDNGTGYKQVNLSKNGKTKKFYIHRLVWECFNEEIPDGYEIDHKDCNKSNNCLSNLQLLTRKANMLKCHEDNPHVIRNLRQYKGL